MNGRKKLTKQQKAFLKMCKAPSRMRHTTIPEYVLKITELHFIIFVLRAWAHLAEVVNDTSVYPTLFPKFVKICLLGWGIGIYALTEERARMLVLNNYSKDEPEFEMVMMAYKIKREIFPDDKVIITEAIGSYNL